MLKQAGRQQQSEHGSHRDAAQLNANRESGGLETGVKGEPLEAPGSPIRLARLTAWSMIPHRIP